MNTWFLKNLGDAMWATEQLAQIEKQFLLYDPTEAMEETAIFVRHESEGRLHCEVVAYFSPAASAIAKACEATPCTKPMRHGLSLLAGAEDSWLVLFPESDL